MAGKKTFSHRPFFGQRKASTCQGAHLQGGQEPPPCRRQSYPPIPPAGHPFSFTDNLILHHCDMRRRPTESNNAEFKKTAARSFKCVNKSVFPFTPILLVFIFYTHMLII